MTNPNLTAPKLEVDFEQVETIQPKQVSKQNIDTRIEKEKRVIAILGLGDGGSNIASLTFVKTKAHSFIYNTSARGVRTQKHTKAIILNDTDGAGQNMGYSLEKYEEQGALAIYELLNGYKKEIDYLFVVAAAGGGTGAGAIEAMTLDIIENFEKGVNPDSEDYFKTLAVVTLPSHTEAGKNFYNALQVQKNLVAKNIPHILFDNQYYTNRNVTATQDVYDRINSDVLDFIEHYMGNHFNGDKLKSSIDSKDFLTIAAHGRRMNFYHSKQAILAKETLDDYILRLVSETAQPEPVSPTCYALFIKGPEEVLTRLDNSLQGIKSRYGAPIQNYIHIEYADNFEVALLTAGSLVHESTISTHSAIYKDSLRSREAKPNLGIFEGLEEDPFAMETFDKPKTEGGFKRAKRD